MFLFVNANLFRKDWTAYFETWRIFRIRFTKQRWCILYIYTFNGPFQETDMFDRDSFQTITVMLVYLDFLNILLYFLTRGLNKLSRPYKVQTFNQQSQLKLTTSKVTYTFVQYAKALKLYWMKWPSSETVALVVTFVSCGITSNVLVLQTNRQSV